MNKRHYGQPHADFSCVTGGITVLHSPSLTRPYRLAVRTPPFHGGGTGSIPVRVAIFHRPARLRNHRPIESEIEIRRRRCGCETEGQRIKASIRQLPRSPNPKREHSGTRVWKQGEYEFRARPGSCDAQRCETVVRDGPGKAQASQIPEDRQPRRCAKKTESRASSYRGSGAGGPNPQSSPPSGGLFVWLTRGRLTFGQSASKF